MIMHREILIALLLLPCPVATSLRGQDRAEPDRDAIRQIVARRLQDPDPQVRMRVIFSAYHNSTAATDPQVLRLLVEAMAGDADASVRRVFATELHWWPNSNLPRDERVHRAVLRATRDTSEEVRYVALHFIARIKFCDQPAIDRLAELLEDEDPKTRWRAARTLGHLGLAAAPTVPKLLRLIDDADYACRQEAIQALGRIGSEPKTVVRALQAALRHDDPLVRADAAQSLGRIGFPEALPAVDALEQLIERTPADVPAGARPRLRASAGFALAAMGDIDDAVFEALGEPVTGADQDLRKEAVMLIGRLGPKAARLTPLLMDQLDEPLRFDPKRYRPMVPTWSTTVLLLGDEIPVPEALARIGDRALQPLTAALSDPSQIVRRRAARALGLMGAKARSAVPRLQRLMHDDDALVRGAAMRSARFWPSKRTSKWTRQAGWKAAKRRENGRLPNVR